MANSVIGALRVMLGMDTSAFEDGAKRATRKGKQLETDMQKIGAGLQKVGLALVSAFAGAAGGMAVLTRQTINTADELSKAAASTGIAVEELSRLRYAADLSGVSFEQLQTAVGRLSRNMFDAGQGLGTAARAFDAMGVAVRNSDGTLRSATDVMGDIADRFAGMKDGAEKTALAMQIFGRAGAEMIPLLNGGRDGLRELTAEADQFGVVIDAETGRKAEAFNDNLTRLQGVFSATATRLAVELLPHLVDFTDWLIENRADIDRGVTKFGDFINGMVRLGRNVASATSWMEERFGAVFRSIAIIINPLQTLIGLVSRYGKQGSGGAMAANARGMLDLGTQAMKRAAEMSRMAREAEAAGEAISRAIGSGSRSASAALAKVASDGQSMANSIRSLLDRLFPEIAEARQQMEDLALLDQAGLDSAKLAEARRRVLGIDGKATVSPGLLDTGPLAEAEKVREASDAIARSMAGLADRNEVQTVRIAETFQDMVDRSLGALRKLADGIKGGGFFGILEGLIGLGTTLGGLGLFGKGVQSRLQGVPAFANGGAMKLGGLGGIDRNVLSLNGSPIARVSAGETMQIRPGSDAGRDVRVTIVDTTGLFVTQVEGAASRVVARAAPAIAAAGAGQAVGRIRQMQSRALA
jgi:hypothetical protein